MQSNAGVASRSSIHRILHLFIIIFVSASEFGKLAWSRWQSRGHGYWWVCLGGFSVGDHGHGGRFFEVEAALAVTIVLLDFVLEALSRSPFGPASARCLHSFCTLSLCALCVADVSLFVGAGGARVSLPLVLFAMSEKMYIVNMVLPWIHVIFFSGACIIPIAVSVGCALSALVIRIAPSHRTPWLFKGVIIILGLCVLIVRNHIAEGVGASLLSQMGADILSFVSGTLFSASLEDTLDSHHVRLLHNSTDTYPPILLFHWEAGSDLILTQGASGANRTAAPFLHSLGSRPDVLLTHGFVTVPMTLKSAWEALCGTPAAITSDFREHGSALRRECLPRVLKRCCGYHSILAKTDTELPELPRRVFGFDEVVVAASNSELVLKLQESLNKAGALDGRTPVFVYVYAGDAHAPFEPSRVSLSERGYSANPTEDVFFALHHRTDGVAEEISRVWPPRPVTPGGVWKREHGLAIYFGDHGELLHEDSPPPHGNVVTPEVTRVLLAVESRSFAARASDTGGLHRLADIFSTVADVVGLQTEGLLHTGKSLLRGGGHASVTSFSFYRPSEVLRVYFTETQLGVDVEQSKEFNRGPWGWKNVDGANVTTPVATLLREALAEREKINAVLTQSNVHAAWLIAKMLAIGKEVAMAAHATARIAILAASTLVNKALDAVLRLTLPAPSTNVCASGDANNDTPPDDPTCATADQNQAQESTVVHDHS